MTHDEAVVKAKAHIMKYEQASGIELKLLEERTIERDFGWVFFYQSRAYAEEGEFSTALAGNAPFVVRKRDGAIVETGTAESVEVYLARLERNGTL